MTHLDYDEVCMSVVVPVFNRPQLIVRCLDAIKAQTYRPLHVIVVDNGSTDCTRDAVCRWMEENIDECSVFSVDLLEDGRHGAAYARQTGLDHVATDKVMFFDSDDTMRPDCVASVMELWKMHPDADAVGWPVAINYPDGLKNTHALRGDLLERHLIHAVFRTHGYAVKTDFIRKAGGWKGEFPNWNDLETGTRILLRDPEVLVIKRPLVDIHPQKESITGTCFSCKHGNWEKSLTGIDRSIEESGRSDKVRLHNIINYRRAILAAHYAKEGHKALAVPLYRQALSEVPKKKRPLIRFAYHWTRLGMRGAFSIIGKFF